MQYRYLNTVLVKLFVFALIFFSLLPSAFVQGTVAIDHFLSSHHMFEYASQHGFLFGRDIIDNVGPYGYLHYPYTFTGGVFWSKMIWFALICGIFAYYATQLISDIRTNTGKCLFLLTILFFPFQYTNPWFSYEILPRLAVLFSALFFLRGYAEKKHVREVGHIVVTGLFYAFLVLEKASNVYYLLLVVALLSLYWLIQNQWRYAVWLSSSFFWGIGLFWLATGQPLSALPIYFESMRHFIDAYQSTLPSDVDDKQLIYALLYCVSILVILLYRLKIAFYTTQKIPEFFRAILIAALVFLAWKHGILRGSLSYGTFLFTIPCLFAFLCFYPLGVVDNNIYHPRLQRLLTYRYSHYFPSAYFLLFLCVVWSQMASYINADTGVIQEFKNRVIALGTYSPVQTLQKLNAKYKQITEENTIPNPLRNSLLAGTVDEFGSTPELIFLNNLNYRPRPIPIEFIVGTATLNEINGRYYQDVNKAPDSVLLSEFGLKLADSNAYLSLLLNYHAQEAVQNWLLMQKNHTWRTIGFEKTAVKQMKFDEWVDLHDLQKSFLWVQLDAHSNLLGQLKNFLYKSDLVQLEVKFNNNALQTNRVSLAALSSGFLLNPIIKSKSALTCIAHDKQALPWDEVKAFRITWIKRKHRILFHHQFNVVFSKVTTTPSLEEQATPLDLSSASKMISVVPADTPISYIHLPRDLLSEETSPDICVEGLAGIERNNTERWRWALGPMTRITFYNDENLRDKTSQLRLQLSFKKEMSFPQQAITIYVNGEEVRRYKTKDIAAAKQIDVDVLFAAKNGLNSIEIGYLDWNRKHDGASYNSNDPRLLSMIINRLVLGPVDNCFHGCKPNANRPLKNVL